MNADQHHPRAHKKGSRKKRVWRMLETLALWIIQKMVSKS